MKASTYLYETSGWLCFRCDRSLHLHHLLCFMFCFQLVNVVYLFSPCLVRPPQEYRLGTYVLSSDDGNFIVAQKRRTENGNLELKLCTVVWQKSPINGASFFWSSLKKTLLLLLPLLPARCSTYREAPPAWLVTPHPVWQGSCSERLHHMLFQCGLVSLIIFNIKRCLFFFPQCLQWKYIRMEMTGLSSSVMIIITITWLWKKTN